MTRFIDVDTRGHWGHVPPPQDFAISKEVLSLSLENASCFLKENVPSMRHAPQSLRYLLRT